MPRRKFLVWMWGCPYKNNVWTAAQMQKCGWLNSYSFSFWFFLKKIEFIFLPIIYQEPGDGDAPSIWASSNKDGMGGGGDLTVAWGATTFHLAVGYLFQDCYIQTFS
jgi:hypothetical protein